MAEFTTSVDTQSKGISPFIATILNFFDNSNELQISNTLSKASILANHNKLNTVYLFDTIAGVTVNKKFDGLNTAIELNTKCNECITLCFPSIEQVLLYEKFANEDRELNESNHSEFLDKHVDELLHCN